MLSKSTKKIIPYRPFHQAIEETLKSAGCFCIRILPEYCSSALPAHGYKMVSTNVCVQIDNCFCVSDPIIFLALSQLKEILICVTNFFEFE